MASHAVPLCPLGKPAGRTSFPPLEARPPCPTRSLREKGERHRDLKRRKREILRDLKRRKGGGFQRFKGEKNEGYCKND